MGEAKSPKITVAVAMHKDYCKPSDPMYMPLQVGAALNRVSFGITRDDSGDNISVLNNSYSELTGLYWLWKNSSDKYKGLVHYRRYLGTKSFSRHFKRDRMDRVIGSDELSELLTEYDLVVPRKRNYFIETVYSHYAHTMHAQQLDETRKVLKVLAPQYIPAFDTVMNRKKVHIFNMFVMQGNLFDAYCAFLFPVLEELTKRVEPTQYDSFHARYPGRVSELLLDVWLETNRRTYVELPVVNIEPVNWLKKGSSFLMAKFFGKKYGKSF